MKVLTVRSKKLFLIVRILVYSLKISGLAPFTVSAKTSTQLVRYQNTRIRAFRFSKIGLAYNLLLLILFIVHNALELPSQCTIPTDLSPTARDTIEEASNVLERVLIVLSASIILASWGFRQNNAASIMNRLLEVDAKISGFEEQPFDKWALTFLILHVTLNAHIVHWFIIEYFTIVGLLARELQTVNKYLLKFEELGNYFPCLPVRSHILVAEIYPTPGRNKLASLQLLRSVRTTLFELCEDMAGFSSLPILFSIVCYFVSLLGQVYWLFMTIGRQREHSSYARNFSWSLEILVAFLYPILLLSLNVTRTVTEAGLTGHIVHKLLAVARKGSEIRRELKEFSLQLLHEHVNFTAYGFFSLDSTITPTILGGIATYFIVIVQFHSTTSH